MASSQSPKSSFIRDILHGDDSVPYLSGAVRAAQMAAETRSRGRRITMEKVVIYEPTPQSPSSASEKELLVDAEPRIARAQQRPPLSPLSQPATASRRRESQSPLGVASRSSSGSRGSRSAEPPILAKGTQAPGVYAINPNSRPPRPESFVRRSQHLSGDHNDDDDAAGFVDPRDELDEMVMLSTVDTIDFERGVVAATAMDPPSRERYESLDFDSDIPDMIDVLSERLEEAEESLRKERKHARRLEAKLLKYRAYVRLLMRQRSDLQARIDNMSPFPVLTSQAPVLSSPAVPETTNRI